MALNAHHTFEELNGIKCSIVEKKCNSQRVEFLKSLLEFNGFTVVVVDTPAQQTTSKPTTDESDTASQENFHSDPPIYTIGVTDLSFNPINGVYNRQLKNQDGKYVTPRYWNQRDDVSRDDIWYWKQR